MRGCVDVALIVRTTRNLDGDEVKELSADSRSGSILLIDAIREAISAIGFDVFVVGVKLTRRAVVKLPHAGRPSSRLQQAEACSFVHSISPDFHRQTSFSSHPLDILILE